MYGKTLFQGFRRVVNFGMVFAHFGLVYSEVFDARCRLSGNTCFPTGAIHPTGSDLSLIARISLDDQLTCNGLQTLSGKFRGFGLTTPKL